MERVDNNLVVPNLKRSDLTTLPHYSKTYESVHINRRPLIYKIEDGKDSIVCLWIDGEKESVLKYYIYSDLQASDLSRYKEAVDKANLELSVPEVKSAIGRVSFPVLSVESVHEIESEPKKRLAVSKSEYVKRLELEAVAHYSRGYLEEELKDSYIPLRDAQKLLLFKDRWISSESFRSEILGRLF